MFNSVHEAVLFAVKNGGTPEYLMPNPHVEEEVVISVEEQAVANSSHVGPLFVVVFHFRDACLCSCLKSRLGSLRRLLRAILPPTSSLAASMFVPR